MKNLLFILITIISVSTYAANDSLPKTKEQVKEFKDKLPDERAKSITDMMSKKLELSSSQYNSIYDINVKYAKLNAAISNKGYSKMKLLSNLKSTNLEREKEILVLLDEKQKETFQQEKSAMISQFKSSKKK